MKWARGIDRLLTLPCRDAARLLSHAMDQDLSPLDRAALSLHLAICGSCRRYRGQLRLLRQVLFVLRDNPPGPRAGEHLAPDARLRIAQQLGRERGNP